MSGLTSIIPTRKCGDRSSPFYKGPLALSENPPHGKCGDRSSPFYTGARARLGESPHTEVWESFKSFLPPTVALVMKWLS